ncbi:MAG: hypothetical protein JNJ61_06580 [Anaerolineae bacterium]|nr:hypothetical protein [Anaerolineae bacterium]
MGIHVEWANRERTLLIYSFGGSWDWNDYQAASEQARGMTGSAAQQVDVILDFRHTNALPQGMMRQFSSSFRSLAYQPHNVDRMVIVGATGLLVIISNVLRNIYPQVTAKVLEAPTLEKAYTLLGLTGQNTTASSG